MYEYHHRDHLGNLRVAFRQQSQQNTTARLSMEPQLAVREEAAFRKVAASRTASAAHSGRYAARLLQQTGPGKTVKLQPGEVLKASVFGFVEEKQKRRTNWLPVPVVADGPPAPEDMFRKKPIIRGGIAIPVKFGRKDSELPEAYLQLVARDSSGKIVSSHTSRLTQAALNGWEELQLTYQAKEHETVEVTLVNASARTSALFDDLTLTQEPPLVVQENHYDPWGLNLVGIETQGNPESKYQYINREKQAEFGINWLDLQARMYGPAEGRFFATDPLPDTEGQESLSPYQYGWNNPVRLSDPDGKCPNCITAGIGALVGGLIGGGVEAASQIIEHGGVTDWGAVGGSAAQGLVTGAVAGFTVGASLAVTVAASAGANVAGGIASRTIQGRETTAGDIALDAAIGAAAGVGGKLLDKAVKSVQIKETAVVSGILRDASKGKGNYGLGTATSKQANKAGKAWVGEGATVASDGKTLVSADKLRQFRPPSPKKSSYAKTGKQANFESRYVKPDGKIISQWQGNGHLNVK